MPQTSMGRIALLGLTLACPGLTSAQPQSPPQTKPITTEVPPAPSEPEAPISEAPASEAQEPEPGALPLAAAVVPGIILHGSGHYVAGDPETAKTLLYMEGAGLLIMVGGVVSLALTGASRRNAGPSVVVTSGGFGLFMGSWLMDLYGAAAGPGSGSASTALPALELSLGHRYVYDPQFEYRHFAHLGYDTWLGRVSLRGRGWLAVDDDNQRLRQSLGYRILGDTANRRGGGYLDANFWLTWHDHNTEGFSVLTYEGDLTGRYDLRRLTPGLRSLFAEGGVGWAVEHYDYDLPGVSLGEDTFDMLLLRMALGVYLPALGTTGGGEISLYYDHRHDDYASGLGTNNIGVGAIGSFGLAATVPVTERWAVDLDLRTGASVIAGLSLRYRYGQAGGVR